MMIEYFEKYTPAIERICRAYNVMRLYAFGSVLTDKFSVESDLDLIVAFDKKKDISLFRDYFGLQRELEVLFQRKVDLMEERPIRNPVLRSEIESTKRMIYGKEGQEVAV